MQKSSRSIFHVNTQLQLGCFPPLVYKELVMKVNGLIKPMAYSHHNPTITTVEHGGRHSWQQMLEVRHPQNSSLVYFSW